MSVIVRIFIGLFLILHGLVLPIMALVPSDKIEDAPVGSFWTESWLFGEGAKVKFAIYGLSAVTALFFILSGIGFIGFFVPYTVVRSLLLAGAGISLFVLMFFWLPWFVLGVVLNALILIAALIWL